MAFDLQPTHLRGKLVALRPLRPDDFDAVFAAASDPLIWEQHPSSDRYTLPVFRKYFDGAIASGGAFLVTDRETGEVIGCSRYHDLREAESQVEIGFTFLIRSRWGGAYNGELKRLMLDHAFRFVKTVVFTAGPTNFRSRRALEKIGAVLQGPGINSAGDPCVVFHLHRA
ncbi:MAG TPA: GNAT family N-acetyltransferase [Terriglobales bacterium]|jgi:RimJ/RimL family protein N-acetyltransferase